MKVGGRIRPPGDKSITHRGLLVAALSRGVSELTGALAADDTRSTARVLRRLGVAVSPLRENVAVRVRGGRWRAPDGALHCGNSGTTARLLLGLLAGQPFTARLTGDRSLRQRPMRRVTEPLRHMGATIVEHAGDGLPLTIRGAPLRGISYQLPVASAQVKSALLLAGLVGGVDVTVREPLRSRDHTERLLQYLGHDVRVRGAEVTLFGGAVRPPVCPPVRLSVPGDFSAAAFLLAAALLADGGELVVEGVGINPTRTGALTVLARMGARIEVVHQREGAGEPVADLVAHPSELRGTEVPAHEVPGLLDEIPALAVLAARAQGESRFRSVGELRRKESDRLEQLARNLRVLAVEAAVEGDDLVVVGTERAPRGRVETAGDHRIAMAFAVLDTVPGAAVELSEVGSVRVSYPRFWADLAAIRRDV